METEIENIKRAINGLRGDLYRAYINTMNKGREGELYDNVQNEANKATNDFLKTLIVP